MTLPSFDFQNPTQYVLWNLGVFFVSFIPNSFVEWLSHRFVLHSKAIVSFAYEEHDRQHHRVYLADQSFSMPGFDYGVDFHLRDWLLFLVMVIPMWVGVEWLVGRPLLVGASLSTLCWLQMFNVLHKHYHVPTGAWFERTRYYRFLIGHHRKHHEDTRVNFNVCFVPIADWVLRTKR